MVKTRNMARDEDGDGEPLTLLAPPVASGATESTAATPFGVTDADSDSERLQSPAPPAPLGLQAAGVSDGSTYTHDVTLQPPGGTTRARRKLLAKARLELAAARLAMLEAECSDDDADSGHTDATARYLPCLASPVTSNAAAADDAAASSSPQLTETLGDLGASGTNAPGSEKLQAHNDASATETRRATEVTPRAAVADTAPAAAPPRHDDAAQPLKDLATAILEVARGGRPAAIRYCLELPIFSGASSEWLHFKAAYVESASDYSNTENLARLRKCLKGAAMEAVKSLFLGSTADRIMEKLECRFGRPNALISQELDKLRHLPKLTDSPRDVCVFASKVSNIIATVEALNRPEYLNSAEMVNTVSDKLTAIIRTRWYDFEMKSGDTEPGLVTLGRFLDREAEINSRHAKAEMADDRRRNDFRSHKSFNVKSGNDTTCVVCDGTCADATACRRFRDMSVSERWEIARKTKLCFRCLRKRSWQHRCKSVQCKAPGCKYHHHKLLHGSDGGVQRSQSGGSVSASLQRATPRTAPCATARCHGGARTEGAACDTATSEGGGKCTSPQHATPCRHDDAVPAVVTSVRSPRTATRTLLKVLPVTVSGPDGEIDTFAILDDGSTVTLMTTATAQRIGAKGPSEPFYIEAVAGARIDAACSQRVKFSIRGRYVGKTMKIEARTIDRLDISAQSVPAKTLVGCNHLTSISEQLVYEKGEPSVLIGQDNWALLLASEVRRGNRNQPVASRTSLGWVVHGQSCNYKNGKGARSQLERCGHVRSIDTDVMSLDRPTREHFNSVPLETKARAHESGYPEAADSIIRNYNMNDFLQSYDTTEEESRVSRAADAVHRRGNFVLQKGASSNRAAVIDLAAAPSAPDALLSKAGKVLGHVWRPADDTNFGNIDSSYDLDKWATKCQLLRIVMSLYDRLGLTTPMKMAKRLLQDTWRLHLGWDERLPGKLLWKWHKWIIALQNLNGVCILRGYPGYSDATKLELHTFVGASESFYATAVYWRLENVKGELRASLAAAKGRVAALKVTSIHRLKSQAAVPEGRRARSVVAEHDRPPERRVFWSASRAGLARRGSCKRVARRGAELEETTAGAEWRWTHSALNIADAVRRDATLITDTGEDRVASTMTASRLRPIEASADPTRFSPGSRLTRANARVLQVIVRCRRHAACVTRTRTQRASTDDPPWKTGTDKACMPHSAQRPTYYFAEEPRDDTGGRPVSTNSRLHQLSLIIDEHSILRRRSRTTATALHERHPREEVLHTLLTEVEHTVNSRPLSHVSVSPKKDEAITPNHFLLGGPSRVPMPGTFTKADELGRSHWRASQRLADLFWDRWVREVLPLLQNRREPVGRGEAIKEGDVVVVVDPALPRNVWPKGRVVRLYPGVDGVIRVVDVQTKSGIMRRPVKRLVILPVE